MAVPNPRNASIIGALRQRYTDVFDALHRIHQQRSFYRRSRYGWIGEAYSLLGLFDTDTLRKTHWHVNCWSNEETMAWKDACISSHNFVMVAVWLTHLRCSVPDSVVDSSI
jgi:hypothetical protein